MSSNISEQAKDRNAKLEDLNEKGRHNRAQERNEKVSNAVKFFTGATSAAMKSKSNSRTARMSGSDSHGSRNDPAFWEVLPGAAASVANIPSSYPLGTNFVSNFAKGDLVQHAIPGVLTLSWIPTLGTNPGTVNHPCATDRAMNGLFSTLRTENTGANAPYDPAEIGLVHVCIDSYLGLFAEGHRLLKALNTQRYENKYLNVGLVGALIGVDGKVEYATGAWATARNHLYAALLDHSQRMVHLKRIPDLVYFKRHRYLNSMVFQDGEDGAYSQLIVTKQQYFYYYDESGSRALPVTSPFCNGYSTVEDAVNRFIDLMDTLYARLVASTTANILFADIWKVYKDSANISCDDIHIDDTVDFIYDPILGNQLKNTDIYHLKDGLHLYDATDQKQATVIGTLNTSSLLAITSDPMTGLLMQGLACKVPLYSLTSHTLPMTGCIGIPINYPSSLTQGPSWTGSVTTQTEQFNCVGLNLMGDTIASGSISVKPALGAYDLVLDGYDHTLSPAEVVEATRGKITCMIPQESFKWYIQGSASPSGTLTANEIYYAYIDNNTAFVTACGSEIFTRMGVTFIDEDDEFYNYDDCLGAWSNFNITALFDTQNMYYLSLQWDYAPRSWNSIYLTQS